METRRKYKIIFTSGEASPKFLVMLRAAKARGFLGVRGHAPMENFEN